MIDLSKKTVCVKDYGLFEEVAVMLAKEFGRVLYYIPNKSAFPKSSLALVGKGFEGVERIPDKEGGKEFEDYEDEIDLYVYPDIMDGGEQMKLRREGKRVWGSGYADKLEINRKLYRQLQKKLKIPAPPTKFINGIDALKEELQKVEDRWVKISLWRGDFETFHHIKWDTTEEKLEEWEYKLGPKKDHVTFLVEEPVEPDGVEVGYDGFSIGGKFPNVCAYGYEIKGAAYIGKVATRETLPWAMKYLNDLHADLFEEYGLQGNMSNEIRIGKARIPYAIDPCMRCGSPPTEALLEVFENWPEVMFAGGDGELKELKPKAKFMALARVCTPEAETNWVTLDFPDDVRQWMKMRNTTAINGKFQCMPCGMDTVASVVGIGDTVQEAVDEVKKHAKDVKGNSVRIYEDDLDAAQEAIDKGKKFGINF